ncbi:hypothetical protein PR048_007913 [Dryococelus australis]|uniref:Uncharacterized protein n=1 Tax=Dryococelus australis TaxID=614101 RepID=A0ABQ9HVL6_9NEOP|nr:hypothetical protein PR048_007913 [Dryococelus australis]
MGGGPEGFRRGEGGGGMACGLPRRRNNEDVHQAAGLSPRQRPHPIRSLSPASIGIVAAPKRCRDRLLSRGRSRIFVCVNGAGRFRSSPGFLGGIPFSQPLISGAAPYSPRSTLIGSQDLDVKRRPNLATLSRLNRRLCSRSADCCSAGFHSRLVPLIPGREINFWYSSSHERTGPADHMVTVEQVPLAPRGVSRRGSPLDMALAQRPPTDQYCPARPPTDISQGNPGPVYYNPEACCGLQNQSDCRGGAPSTRPPLLRHQFITLLTEGPLPVMSQTASDLYNGLLDVCPHLGRGMKYFRRPAPAYARSI